MVGQSKLSICLRALVPEPSNDILHMSDLTPSQCFRAIALSLAIDPNKIPSLFSVVEYEGHHHPLYFIDKSSSELHECNAYDSYCSRLKVSDEFSQTKPFIFRCQQCNFNVHLLCGPLPPIIKSKLHFHPLTLVDSLWEDNSGDYYCDVCEEGRNPQIWVYAREECKYVADIHCMIYEFPHLSSSVFLESSQPAVPPATRTAIAAAQGQTSLISYCVLTREYEDLMRNGTPTGFFLSVWRWSYFS